MRSAGMVGLGFDRAAGLLASGLRARIACVVTDLHMPEMTGLELQSELARQGWTQPVILIDRLIPPPPRARRQRLVVRRPFSPSR
ncbi:response regulator [Novosphingobium sp. ST904]|uniref:response regulator n=1 Tax=Novosphingobium sp. ST904 TaxID=1684385 RepID=UPI0006C84529|nr:response regulator [Novosphingobium sp. ST904]